MKNTIIISAVTSFVVFVILNILGWLVCPIGWVICGYLAYSQNEKYRSHDKFPLAGFLFGGPIGLVGVYALLWGEESLPFKMPKFRNPFIWPEK